MLNKIESVVVFDLDDTLYKEVEYLKSGFVEVISYLARLYGESFLIKAGQISPEKNIDWMGGLCTLLNLPPSAKDSLLWIYRLHQPSISLTLDARNLLEKLSKKSQLAILTDGRSFSQRQKIKALGLNNLPAYISEEYGANKPDLFGFKKIMLDFPARRYFYVGDNPLKDFIAPNYLGWTSICLRNNGNNIHPQSMVNLSESQAPVIWIDALEDLLVYTC